MKRPLGMQMHLKSGFLDIFLRIPGPGGLPDWDQVKPSLFQIFPEDCFGISVVKPQSSPSLLSVGPNIADGSNVDGPNYPRQMLIRPQLRWSIGVACAN